MDSINKMSRESQSAIYSKKMAKALGLPPEDATPENIQREIRRTFSDLRAGNVSEQTVLTIEQLKKSLETAKRISDLANATLTPLMDIVRKKLDEIPKEDLDKIAEFAKNGGFKEV